MPPRPALALAEPEARFSLFADDFNQDAFASPSVKFPVKDLLPGTKIELSIGDGDDDLAPHDLAFDMGIAIILTR